MATTKIKPRPRVSRSVVRERERKLKASIRATASSEPWVEASVGYSDSAVDEKNEPVGIPYQIKGVYPVRGMVRCRGCERHVSPLYLTSSNHCQDCEYGSMSPLQLSRLQGSTSVVNMARLKASRRRGDETFKGGI